MTKSSSRPYRLTSWIPPSFAWTLAPDVFFIDVLVRDTDIVEFISSGVREFTVYGTKKAAPVLAALMGRDSLQVQLERAARSPGKLKPAGSRVIVGTKVIAYCHGVFLLPDNETLCVVVGRSKPVKPDGWISMSLKADVDALLQDHRFKVEEFEKGIRRKKQENEAIKERYFSENSFGAWGDAMIAREEAWQRPVVTLEPLLRSLPRAVRFAAPISSGPEKVDRAALLVIEASDLLPPRDGNYAGILAGAGRRVQGIVSWEPHTGLASYPEIRWAVQTRLPRALRKPRIEQVGKSMLDTSAQPTEGSVHIHGFDADSLDLKDSLDELQLDQNDYRRRVDRIRKDSKERGFEAIAWYQPYHVWTEETWGIYFDASKPNDLALSFLEDFRSQGVHGSHSLAAILAFGLTYAHEMFHARVEAALSWQELNAQRPRHLRYKERVYQELRETPDWLEEGLANWWAWNWFKASQTQARIVPMSSRSEGLIRVVEASLDLAPPGYQEWRLGHHPSTWRTFAHQLSTGKPKITSAGIALPLEGALTGPLPFDLHTSDIPLRFVGSGIIADRLQSHPATFNVPPRRELERALKFFRHRLDASGGKGGHQKWTGPDQRAFILPTRDPVSTGVFKSFLHHVGINKATYVRQVRPQL